MTEPMTVEQIASARKALDVIEGRIVSLRGRLDRTVADQRGIPAHTLAIDALTDDVLDPEMAVQYCVVGEDGFRHVYGDQQWIADGRVLRYHPDGQIQRRVITITYGDWEAADV